MRHMRSFLPSVMAPALVAIGLLAGMPAPAEILSQDQIARQIIGKDLTTVRLGMTVHLRYNLDGSITMKAAFATGLGHWDYDGDGLCMTMTKGPKRGMTCTEFEALDDGSYRNSEGLILWVQK